MKLNRGHIFYLAFMNYSILNLWLLPFAFHIVGRDLWLSTLAAGAIGVLVAVVMWNFDRSHPEEGAMDAALSGSGKWFQTALLVVSILYLLFLCITGTAYVAQFISIGFIQETPFKVIVLVFVLVTAYAVHRGIWAIANAAGIFSLLAMVTGSIMSLSITVHRQMNNFLPIAENGIGPILLGTLLFVPIWTEMFFLLFVPRKTFEGRQWLNTYLWIVGVNTFVFIGHTIGPVSVFGIEQTKNMNFPELNSVKVIGLGFIDRFDVYGLALMIFGTFVRVSFYGWLMLSHVYRLLKQNPTKVSWLGPASTAAALWLGAIVLFPDSVFFTSLTGPFVYSSVGFLAFFALSVLYLSRRRKV
ncbi:spore germination protein [Alicyclobacillus tolerans]|uniref:GerAB/ArcD/ProY family transporter n=1 Tax=Alicyclobacillus tolerans TaxID=90970 RepID=UPI001F2DF6F7|nr:GerAB/ArcD/ProY family transporter [Alicyclobacillus tolerans]MCF8564953.1 spore germination protein [Alicyclobacillus tolerans]